MSSLITSDDRLLIVVAHDDDAALMGSSLLLARCPKRLFCLTFSDAVGGSRQGCLDAYRDVQGLEVVGSEAATSLDMDVRVRRFLIEECMAQMTDFSPSILLTNHPWDRHHDHRSAWSIVDQALFHLATWKGGGRPRMVLSGEVIEPMPAPTLALPAAVSLKSEIMGRFRSGRDDFPWLETNLALNRFRAFQMEHGAHEASEAYRVHHLRFERLE